MAYENVKDLMTAICDAVREKEGSSDLIPHQELPERISGIFGAETVVDELKYKIVTISTGGFDASIRVDNLANDTSTTIPYKTVENGSYEDFGDFRISYDGSITSWCITATTNVLSVGLTILNKGGKATWKYNTSIEYDIMVRTAVGTDSDKYTVHFYSDGKIVESHRAKIGHSINAPIDYKPLWTNSDNKYVSFPFSCDTNGILTFTYQNLEDQFVPLIPVMTDVNAPSGKIESGNNYGNGSYGNIPLYYAFDGDDTTNVHYMTENVENGFISYEFDNDVYVDTIIAKFGNCVVSNDISATLYVYKNDYEYTVIDTVQVSGYPEPEYGEFLFKVASVCKKIKFVFGYKTNGTNIETYEIQAYGLNNIKSYTYYNRTTVDNSVLGDIKWAKGSAVTMNDDTFLQDGYIQLSDGAGANKDGFIITEKTVPLNKYTSVTVTFMQENSAGTSYWLELGFCSQNETAWDMNGVVNVNETKLPTQLSTDIVSKTISIGTYNSNGQELYFYLASNGHTNIYSIVFNP